MGKEIWAITNAASVRRSAPAAVPLILLHAWDPLDEFLAPCPPFQQWYRVYSAGAGSEYPFRNMDYTMLGVLGHAYVQLALRAENTDVLRSVLRQVGSTPTTDPTTLLICPIFTLGTATTVHHIHSRTVMG